MDTPTAADAANGGDYNINNNSSTLTLTLTTPASVVNDIAIYDGYDNRDDGTYTIGYTNAVGTAFTLGSYSISSPSTNSNTESTDDLVLALTTPITANTITIAFSNGTDTQFSDSFEDIQVFTATPEPTTYALLVLGLGGLVAFQRLRRARA